MCVGSSQCVVACAPCGLTRDTSEAWTGHVNHHAKHGATECGHCWVLCRHWWGDDASRSERRSRSVSSSGACRHSREASRQNTHHLLHTHTHTPPTHSFFAAALKALRGSTHNANLSHLAAVANMAWVHYNKNNHADAIKHAKEVISWYGPSCCFPSASPTMVATRVHSHCVSSHPTHRSYESLEAAGKWIIVADFAKLLASAATVLWRTKQAEDAHKALHWCVLQGWANTHTHANSRSLTTPLRVWLAVQRWWRPSCSAERRVMTQQHTAKWAWLQCA